MERSKPAGTPTDREPFCLLITLTERTTHPAPLLAPVHAERRERETVNKILKDLLASVDRMPRFKNFGLVRR